MRGKALNAKYSVSLCLPFPSGTLPPPELFTADLEDELVLLEDELVLLEHHIWILERREIMKGE